MSATTPKALSRIKIYVLVVFIKDKWTTEIVATVLLNWKRMAKDIAN